MAVSILPRIEETVEKARKEVEAKIKQDGERAVLETGIHSIHPELVKLLGRLRYRTQPMVRTYWIIRWRWPILPA